MIYNKSARIPIEVKKISLHVRFSETKIEAGNQKQN